MEIDTKKETGKLQAEIAQLTGQVQQINSEMAQLGEGRQQLVNRLLMKQGALELLQSLGKEG